jgi:hypothetical protein
VLTEMAGSVAGHDGEGRVALQRFWVLGYFISSPLLGDARAGLFSRSSCLLLLWSIAVFL